MPSVLENDFKDETIYLRPILKELCLHSGPMGLSATRFGIFIAALSCKFQSRKVCFCVYLRSAGQCEEQVKRRLCEVEVVFGAQAELHSAEH